MLTLAPVSFSNWAFAAATIGFQLSACASVCSQTVMLFAACRPVPPDAPPDTVATTVARPAASASTAMMRVLIDAPPPRG